MKLQELVEFVQQQIKLNPRLADATILAPQGGEIEGLSYGTNGVSLSTDFRPKVEKESALEYFEAIFKLADISIKRHWQLANGYWPEAYMRLCMENPWWLVETDFDLIKIGWRKRVIEICWYKKDVIVTLDNVTKDERMVHAHSVEKAIEYLKALKREYSRDS